MFDTAFGVVGGRVAIGFAFAAECVEGAGGGVAGGRAATGFDFAAAKDAEGAGARFASSAAFAVEGAEGDGGATLAAAASLSFLEARLVLGADFCCIWPAVAASEARVASDASNASGSLVAQPSAQPMQ